MRYCKKFLAVVLAAVLALTMLTACGGGTKPSGVDLEAQKQQLIASINAVRVKNGQPKLEENAEADKIAQKYVELQKQRNDDAITYEEYTQQTIQLSRTKLYGQEKKGYYLTNSPEVPAVKMDTTYWQNQYDTGLVAASDVAIVRDREGEPSQWIGVVVLQEEDDWFITAIVTY